MLLHGWVHWYWRVWKAWGQIYKSLFIKTMVKTPKMYRFFTVPGSGCSGLAAIKKAILSQVTRWL